MNSGQSLWRKMAFLTSESRPKLNTSLNPDAVAFALVVADVPEAHVATILSVGYDAQLLHIRSAVLRNSGYAVVEVRDPQQALSRFLKTTPDLVLLCHTIDPQRKAILIHGIHAFARKTPIVALDTGYSTVEADAVISSMDGPGEMLKALDHLLSREHRSV